MLQKRSFVKKTKHGKVTNVVREHYLRDDIWSGSPLDPECDPTCHKLSATATQYLIIDASIGMHQLDFLEHRAVTNVIVCSTVLEELRSRNIAAYDRLRALLSGGVDKYFYTFANEHHRETYVGGPGPGESANERNDRAILAAAAWYAKKLPSIQIVLLSNNAAIRRAAEVQGITAMSAAAYARSRGQDAPDLQDLVAGGEGDEEGAAEGKGPEDMDVGTSKGTDGRIRKRARIYPDHLGMSEVEAGLKEGRLHQGTLRVNRFNPFDGIVSSESVGADIRIYGRLAMNRALDGDVVAVELLPPDVAAQLRRKGGSTKAKAAAVTAVADGAKKEDGKEEEKEDEEEEEEEEEVATELFQVAAGDEPSTAAAPDSNEPVGCVVGVLKRNWRQRGYCGSLLLPQHSRGSRSSANVLVVPVERRYPRIRITTRQLETLSDKRILVSIDSWPVDSGYPMGHYVRTIGTVGDKDVETEVLLIENDINTAPFTQAVYDCVPPTPWVLTPAHVAQPGRRDLRHICVCSVDPPGCKDIDDALHARVLENGNYEVGVHIADVSHFVRPGTPIDVEASIRATSVYLVQRRIDMLPKALTEDICSLRGGEERLTFSVMWTMTPDAEVLDVTFTKAIIRSRAALSYAEAQARLDDERLSDEITVGLRLLAHLARILRKRRADAGALQLASPEVKFVLDSETQDPLDVGMYQVREANQMVEEFMLLANVTVAEATVKAFPSCALLRRHPVPPARQFDALLRAAASAGFTLDVTSSKSLAESLDAAVRASDPYFNKLVRILTTRCMTQALYFASADHSSAEFHHYGLAAPLYTHFTSPIRRYADVVVHRLLAALLHIDPLPDSLRDRAGLRACAANLNTRHHNAQMAGRASVELHTLIFFRNRVVEEEARVTKITPRGLIVFVPKYGIEGPVFLTSRADRQQNGMSTSAAAAAAKFRFDEEAQALVSQEDPSVRFVIFDCCRVRISIAIALGQRQTLMLELVLDSMHV